MMNKCRDCGADMIQGFTSAYCKAECDLVPRKTVSTVTALADLFANEMAESLSDMMRFGVGNGLGAWARLEDAYDGEDAVKSHYRKTAEAYLDKHPRTAFFVIGPGVFDAWIAAEGGHDGVGYVCITVRERPVYVDVDFPPQYGMMGFEGEPDWFFEWVERND